MSHINGFVIAVPTASKEKFIELGAIRVIEG